MNDVNKAILTAAEQVAPNSPIVELAKAAIETSANPTSPVTLVEDIELALSLIKEFKQKLEGVPLSARSVLKTLFNLVF